MAKEKAGQNVKKGQSKKQHGGSGAGKVLSAEQVLKTLSQAAKKARTFESQKIIRKLKKLKEEDGDHEAETKDLESQLEAVKNVDLAVAASTTLKSYCNKHQLALPSDLELEAAKPDTATPQGKALNRVLANKHLHEAVTASAPKISPSSSAAATFSTKSKSQAAQDDDAPLAGPSKGAASDSKSENKKQKKEASAKHAPAGTSTFLPSLSGGFTFGDSDNEDSYSLSEGEDHDPSEPQRKNRRGQRARRAIWEKKFGKNAKHLQKAAHAEQLAKAAVDAKQASRSKKRRAPDTEEPRTSHQQPRQQAQHNDREIKRPRKTEAQADDEANLHPSWKARKAAAEKASLGVAGGGFSGTKITFDD